MAWKFYLKYLLLCEAVFLPPGPYPGEPLFPVRLSFYRQGLILGNRCSQRSEAWLPAAGTPLLQGRPGRGNRPVIGPAARIAWCGGRTRRHSKGDGPNLDLTQAQPGTPGRFLGGNALSGFWCLLPAQKAPPAGSVPTRLASRNHGRLDGQTHKKGGSPRLPPSLIPQWQCLPR